MSCGCGGGELVCEHRSNARGHESRRRIVTNATGTTIRHWRVGAALSRACRRGGSHAWNDWNKGVEAVSKRSWNASQRPTMNMKRVLKFVRFTALALLVLQSCLAAFAQGEKSVGGDKETSQSCLTGAGTGSSVTTATKTG